MKTAHTLMDSVNTRVYHHPDIIHQYGMDTLAREDAMGLLKYQSAFANRDVLDIGVGRGRTAIYLAPLAHRYQAIDYSRMMVDACSRALPEVAVEQADMRDLSRFPDASFDFVLASNNVFDAVGHEDRQHVLAGVHRVLRPGGMLMFSSHNRDARNLMHWPHLDFVRNPVTQAKLTVHWCLSMVHHARLRHAESSNDIYAIVNDEAHDSGLLHYYIGPAAQRQQLTQHGFELLDTLDRYGVPVPAGSHAEHSRWLLYVARRLAVS